MYYNFLFFWEKLFCLLFPKSYSTFPKAIPLNGRNRNILIFCDKLFCLTGGIEVIWFLVRKAILLNPKRCGLFGQLRMRGGGQNDPLRDSSLWMLIFLLQLNKQYLIWKLASSAKIWDLIEVAEAHSLASGGIGSDRGQSEKKLRRKS